jgi:hypothetical protein
MVPGLSTNTAVRSALAPNIQALYELICQNKDGLGSEIYETTHFDSGE